MTNKIQKRKLEDIVNGLLSDSATESVMAGERLAKDAKEANMSLDKFLDYAVDLSEGEASDLHAKGLSGYEMVNLKMGLPTKNDPRNQVSLAQASETFATKPGSRVLFPYTVDNVLRWNSRMDTMERVEDLIASSRTITGNELVRTVLEDTAEDRKTFRVSEGARIPVRRVKLSNTAVDIFKHASGIEFTYEFERRASLDVITPFAARVERDLQLSKIGSATNIIISGDGVNAAAATLDQATLDPQATDGKISYDGILAACAIAAKNHTPIDTIAGDIDAYMQLVKLFGTPATSSAFAADQMAQKGAPQFLQLSNIFLPIRFVLNSAVPAGKLLMFNRADTLEEIVESGSRIQEEERAVRSQVITYVKSENTGYGLVYGDTRWVYTYKK
jgi:hypothetical protein